MVNSIKKLTKKYEKESFEDSEEILKKSLLKKAKGFILEEIIEEYSKDEEDSKLILNKKKITTKEVPPDTAAIKFLIEMGTFDKNKFANMTDEELEVEKKRLLKLLKEEEYEV